MIKDINRKTFKEIGKLEKLKGEISDYWGRYINETNATHGSLVIYADYSYIYTCSYKGRKLIKDEKIRTSEKL